jgi:hypothetical protein
MMTKRLTATLVIVAWTLMSFESTWGELRDGDVHHESASEALQHRAASAGSPEHGHAEDLGGAAQGDEQDGDHQHGSSSDHCTHVHGSALIMTVVYVAPASLPHAWDRPTPPPPYGIPAEVLPHPPKV